MAERILIQQTSSGEPVSVGDLTVYPVARSYRMIFPGGQGGMVWNKPLGVIVEDSAAAGKQFQCQMLPVAYKWLFLRLDLSDHYSHG